MDHQEVEALRRSREDEYRKDMDAIARVLRMLGEQTGTRTEPERPAPLPASDNGVIPKADVNSETSPAVTVRQVLGDVPERFTIQDIRTHLEKKFPGVDTSAGSVSPVLRRLVLQKKVAVEKAGKGSMPTIYRKLGQMPDRLFKEETTTAEP